MKTRSVRCWLAGSAAALLWAAWACRTSAANAPSSVWWKGNTHTHTLWSDGDGAPELVTSFYREHDYAFLVLSDHNTLSRGEKWFPIREGANSRLTAARVDELRAKFGVDAMRVREVDGKRELELATLEELRARFEAPGEFVMIEGEEITDKVGDAPLHINALNLGEALKPQGGATIREAIAANLAQVKAQSERLARPMLAHINHPNFGWGVTWQDLAAVADERFFEVYNGHPSVRNEGDATRPGVEEMWDLANTLRLRTLGFESLFGVATDDSHNYHAWGVGKVNPGRGWVMVRATRLDAASIVEAMNAGDFYATSGVVLTDVRRSESSYVVDINAQSGVTYTTRFIGVLRSGGERAIVLDESAADPASYAMTGDELFVRAVVVSTRVHPNPYREGDYETAWCQPFAPHGDRTKAR